MRNVRRERDSALAGAALGAACSAALPSRSSSNIAIATGGTGGVYYPMGGGMANVLSKHLPGVQATARVTGGSVDNLKLVGIRQSEVALHDGRRGARCAEGRGQVQGQPRSTVRTLMVLYPNRMHVVSVEGTGIEKMSDLKGKRVSTGSPGSATEVMAFRVIEAAGLDRDKDMRRERLGVAESTNALKDGKIDAYFWVGGLPTAAVTDLGATPGVKIKMIDHAEVVEKMNAEIRRASIATGVIPAKTYPGQDKDNKIAVVQNILVADAEDAGQGRLRHRQDAVSRSATKSRWRMARRRRSRSITRTARTRPIPWHPGAEKYFKEARREDVIAAQRSLCQ